jgi:hypothetical protein
MNSKHSNPRQRGGSKFMLRLFRLPEEKEEQGKSQATTEHVWVVCKPVGTQEAITSTRDDTDPVLKWIKTISPRIEPQRSLQPVGDAGSRLDEELIPTAGEHNRGWLFYQEKVYSKSMKPDCMIKGQLGLDRGDSGCPFP